MTIKFFLIVSLFLLSLSTYSNQKRIVIPQDDYYLTSKERSRYAIFKFDADRDHNIFDKSVKPTTLSKNELGNIERLIRKRVLAFNQNNKYAKVKFELIKKPEKYFKQFIAVVNPKGEKEVWVNCCCTVIHNYWKTHIPINADGGSCYFQLKINLTKNVVYDFYVNGVA